MAQDSQNTESLFDFAYLDRDRLASFSAQIFDNGALVSVKTEDKTHEHIASEMSSGLKPIFSAVEKENLTNIRGIEKQFDAGWALPLNVLHRLDEMGMIRRSLADADFGDLVLFTGSMNLIDVGIMQNLWEPIVAMEAAKTPSVKTAAKQRAAQQEKAQTKHVVEMLKHLPHTIQLRIFNQEEQAWASLRREYLTINAEDFPLKHGPSISGTWHCLAILDAKPSPETEDDGDPLNIPDGASELEIAMWQLSLQLRIMFGRRFHDYGVTPIALFRSIRARAR